MLGRFFQRQRERFERDTRGSEWYWRLSPALFLARTKLVDQLRTFSTGRLLDVGCGRMPFREYLEDQVEAYHGLDVERRSEATLYLGNAQDMSMVETASYDTVVSISALEHMKEPWLAFAEMRRVCKPGGHLIIGVPHLSRLHEEPHDYYRFTRHGLRAMGERAGLEIVAVEPHGGLFSFIAHQCSTALVCGLWPIPGLRWVALLANYSLLVRPSVFLDSALGTATKAPMNMVGVFRVPLEPDPVESGDAD